MTALFSARHPHATGGFDQYLQWGINADRDQAFWLAQQIVGRPLIGERSHDVTLAVFDRRTRETAQVHDSEVLDGRGIARWQRHGSWVAQASNWPSGSYASSEPEHARGRLFTSQGSAQWQWQAGEASEAVMLGWPLGGLQGTTRRVAGQAEAAGLRIAGSLRMASLQRWGRFSSAGMAFMQCPQLTQDPDVSFLAHAQSLAPQWQRREALAATVGWLQVGGQRHRFERWWTAPTVDAPRLDNYRWLGTLVNASHRLDIAVDGDNPRVTPWIAMNEQLPGGGRRVLRITPFAQLHLRLYARGSQQVLREMRSDGCLLMTALPGAQVFSRGMRAEP